MSNVLRLSKSAGLCGHAFNAAQKMAALLECEIICMTGIPESLKSQHTHQHSVKPS